MPQNRSMNSGAGKAQHTSAFDMQSQGSTCPKSLYQVDEEAISLEQIVTEYQVYSEQNFTFENSMFDSLAEYSPSYTYQIKVPKPK